MLAQAPITVSLQPASFSQYEDTGPSRPKLKPQQRAARQKTTSARTRCAVAVSIASPLFPAGSFSRGLAVAVLLRPVLLVVLLLPPIFQEAGDVRSVQRPRLVGDHL